jgi:hypothetical protein
MHGIVGIPVSPHAVHFTLSAARAPAGRASAYQAIATTRTGLAWMSRLGG